jgi:hypothetical protein
MSTKNLIYFDEKLKNEERQTGGITEPAYAQTAQTAYSLSSSSFFR